MNKTKYLWGLLAVPAMIMTSCSADEGTEPGSDSNPAVTLYSYAPSSEYNADNDVTVRFATNNKTSEVYYVVEKTADLQSYMVDNKLTDAYVDHVIAAGEKFAVEGESNIDKTFTGMVGPYTIAAVAVNGGKRHLATVEFLGLDWEHVVNGTYYFGFTGIAQIANGMTENVTELQRCTTDANLYRFRDVYGAGYSLKINLIDFWGQDKKDDPSTRYQFFRVPRQNTPFVYGNYGNVFVQDVGYWQGSSQFVTEGGYESGMYEDYSCFVLLNWSVSAGNLAKPGYFYDEFVPDNE